MSEEPRRNVTELLQAWSGGDRAALDELLPHVQDELRGIARLQMRRERADHTLQPTALVNEAYLRLVNQNRVRWQDRAHFFAVAAQKMRRILVDHARKRGAEKRGGGEILVALDEGIDPGTPPEDVNVVALDEALEELAVLDERQSRVVEMRFFGGVTLKETAEALGVSPATVKRDWQTAKAWLFRRLHEA